MSKKEGKELATVKVYLNTGIIASLIAIGFVSASLFFGVLLLLLKWIQAYYEFSIMCLNA